MSEFPNWMESDFSHNAPFAVEQHPRTVFSCTQWRTATKTHKCSICGEDIEVGQRHLYQSEKNEFGEWNSRRWHARMAPMGPFERVIYCDEKDY